MTRLPLAVVGDAFRRLVRRPSAALPRTANPSPLARARVGDSTWLFGRLYAVDAARRFGLIETQDGRIVYFHVTALAEARIEELTAAAAVLFDEKIDRLGRQARTVLLVSAPQTAVTSSVSLGAECQNAQPPVLGADAGRSRSVA